MSLGQFGFVANDNDPPTVAPEGDTVGFRAVLRDKQRDYTRLRKSGPVMDLKPKKTLGRTTLFISIIIWLCASVGTAFTLSSPVTAQLSAQVAALSAIALIWTSLWLFYLARDMAAYRLSEMSMLGGLGGFAALIYVIISRYGMPLDPNQALALLAVTALIIMVFSKSTIALLVSIGTAFLWTGMILDGQVMRSDLWLTLPIIFAAQGLAAQVLRSPLANLFTVIVVFFALGGWAVMEFEAGQLSPLHIAGSAMAIGIMHFIASTRAMDKPTSLTSLHQALGFCLAMAGATAIMHFWIYPEADMWTDAFSNAPINSALTLGLSAIALGLAFLLSFFRPSARILSALLCVALALPILSVWQYDEALRVIDRELRMPAHPLIGYVLAGTIFATAFMVALRSYRRENYINTLLALGAIAVISNLLFTSDVPSTLDMQIMALSGLLTMCTAILLSGGTQSVSAPYRRSVTYA